MQEQIRKALIRALVQRQITCPRTGEVLDVRTCVVLVDADGDPAYVMSQAGWAQLTEAERATLDQEHHITVDPSTVK